jgi:hypothetical protein
VAASPNSLVVIFVVARHERAAPAAAAAVALITLFVGNVDPLHGDSDMCCRDAISSEVPRGCYDFMARSDKPTIFQPVEPERLIRFVRITSPAATMKVEHRSPPLHRRLAHASFLVVASGSSEARSDLAMACAVKLGPRRLTAAGVAASQ